MEIKVVHCSFPLVGEKEQAGCCPMAYIVAVAGFLSMHISADVLPISPGAGETAKKCAHCSGQKQWRSGENEP
jgi:hypothetical protein